MKRLSIVSGAVLLTSALCANAAPYVSNEGHQYGLQCTAMGYELTSLYPVARFIEAGISSKVATGTERISLGSNCKVRNKVFGLGKWCWANGGLFITFPAHKIAFSRQELFCQPTPPYDMNCGC